jgi:hypothetical protein
VYDLQVLSLDPILRYRRVTEVEHRLQSHQQKTREEKAVGRKDNRDSKVSVIIRLYQMAALIYLEHIRHWTSDERQPILQNKAVHDGLTLLACVDIREVPWPSFVIGCEAVTDIQRGRILQLLNTEKFDVGGPTPRGMIEAFWIQDDLDTARKLSYVEKMSAVICAAPSLPSFA